MPTDETSIIRMVLHARYRRNEGGDCGQVERRNGVERSRSERLAFERQIQRRFGPLKSRKFPRRHREYICAPAHVSIHCTYYHPRRAADELEEATKEGRNFVSW